MARIVTVYCCGTSFHRGKSDEAVADTWRWTAGAGPDSQTTWINDGPGSDMAIRKLEGVMKVAEGPAEARKRSEMGRREGRRYDKAATQYQQEHQTGTEPKILQKTHGKVGGKTGGRGWASNVTMTLQWLWLQYYSQPFDTVNLAGWSRGGVTCIMIAHAMKEAGFAGHGVTVNLFAFDPVPGGKGDFATQGKDFDTTGKVGSPKQLPDIVRDYEAVLMEHVDKSFLVGGDSCWDCVSPAVVANDSTNKTEYPLPGQHDDCVKWNKVGNPAGKIAMHLCHRFLLGHATPLTQSRTLTDVELLEAYSELSGKFSTVKANKGRAKSIINVLRGDPYFVNTHHRTILQRLSPEWYRYLSGWPIESRRLAQMITRCALTMPKTYAALLNAGLIPA